MYAVIFRARIANLDEEYVRLAAQLRQLAFEKYGCLDFIALSEGEQELAISYWPDEDAIVAWKADPLHRHAQQQGRKLWYQDYQVQVVKVTRQYPALQ
ncbi:antibiotic biosynthesis monooxygenase family protein [Bowmanella pacifica]|uniref:Antibiotic biosynthesis monooxygenase n=1 Tax=Bowmanella pacifica TaxID=502051 RepID=A0A917YQY7_9ALTE|nr:antibiotic biosynthesis monooxygenase [Bowmanella pacifica]GGO64341.1 hypothetical protein GCM10010982_03510 [Bowmanella pacifica]